MMHRYVLTGLYVLTMAFAATAAGFDAEPGDAPAAVFTCLAAFTGIPLGAALLKWIFEDVLTSTRIR